MPQGYLIESTNFDYPKTNNNQLKTIKIKTKELLYFYHKLSIFYAAGISVTNAFEMIIQLIDHQKFKAILKNIAFDISSGVALSEALKKYPKIFQKLDIYLIKTGEASGQLEIILKQITDYKEAIEALKKKVKKATYYPLFLLSIALLMTVLMLIFVIPTFENLFDQFNAELPYFTQLIISLSKWLLKNYFVIFLIISLLIGIFYYLKKKSISFNHYFDQFILKLPFLGHMIRGVILARFLRTFAICFKAGLSLIEIFELLAQISNNHHYEKKLLKVKEKILQGNNLADSLRSVSKNDFPNLITQMIAIGELSGTLDVMLIKLAKIYFDLMLEKFSQLSTILEPLIMLSLGVIIGGIILAMYLPIFQLGSII